MHTDDDKTHNGNEEEIFSGEVIGEDILDEFEEGSHLEEDELAHPLHHSDAEDDELFDFFGDEDDQDGMY